MRVLVIEADRRLAQAMRQALDRHGYEVDLPTDVEDALAVLQARPPDAAVLDLAMSEPGELTLLCRLRALQIDVPVLVVAARASVRDRVLVLNAGADDFLSKPFDLDEFEARVRALTRRSQRGGHRASRCGRLWCDIGSGAFYVDQSILELTPREQALLRTLIDCTGEPVPKQRAHRSVFALETHIRRQALDVVAHRLRRKLQGSGTELATIRGVGYVLRADQHMEREKAAGA
jgi:two-component system response regulator TctD